MSKPIILTLDDEPQVLNAINRDLRQHFRSDYRVVRASSGAEALATLRELKARGEPVALLLSDQRMPQMSGTEFLAAAMLLYPDARKVLLTAYADTEAAIRSINEIGLDYYLMKPWDPPDQNLYPVLDDLLEDWSASADLPYEGIRVAGTLWSPASHTLKDFLSRNRIPFQWLDIELDSAARALAEAHQVEGRTVLPVVFLPDGRTLVNPDIHAIATEVGLKTQATNPYYDFIIIGGGPAGLAAAVYGASEGLHTLLIEKEATGGQAGTSSRIENYLGFPKGLSGAELAQRATVQAIRLGTEILTAVAVLRVRLEGEYKHLTLSNGSEVSCKALLIASGVSVRKLEVPGVEQFSGAGIYYGAALTEAANYQGQDVIVVGGANSAGQGAMFFSRFARSVTMLVRGTSLALGMSQYLVDQIAQVPNITVRTRTEVVSVQGGDRLEGVRIRNFDEGVEYDLPAAAMFIFIGAEAHTGFLDGVVACNKKGFIITGPDLVEVDSPARPATGRWPRGWPRKRDPFLLETSIPGIFAAGDVRHDSTKRVASAVGEGSVCVRFVHQYLKEV